MFKGEQWVMIKKKTNKQKKSKKTKENIQELLVNILMIATAKF